MKAVALSLKQHPMVNASLDMENGQIIYKEYVNLGIAVDTARGLVVPVMRNVDRLTIPHIAQSLTDAGRKGQGHASSRSTICAAARSRSATWASIGGTYSTPIINYPEVAILLVGRSRKLPVVVDDRHRAAADDAAKPFVRPSAGRRGRGGPLPERSDRLSAIARPAALGALRRRTGRDFVLPGPAGRFTRPKRSKFGKIAIFPRPNFG